MRVRWGLLLLPLTLGGCVSSSATLRTADGRTVTCEASGPGLIGGLIANDEFQRCMQHYGKDGFVSEARATGGASTH